MARKPFRSESANALLLHAKRRISELEGLEKTFSDTHPYEVLKDPHTYPGQVLYIAKIVSTPPIELAPVAFDVLHALRSSLDHVVFDASRWLGGNPRPKFTKFPFGKTKQDAIDDLGRKKSEVPLALRAYLLSHKPYRRGNKALWGLNDLRNSKVHKTLGTVGMASGSTVIGRWPRGGHIGHLTGIPLNQWDGRKHQLTYLRATTHEDVNVDIEIIVRITFGDSPAFKGKPAISVLKQLHSVCSDIVAGVEAEATRLTALT